MTERKMIVVLMCILLLAACHSDASAINSKAGTYAYSFLKVPVGAKAPAMGGAYTGLSDDESALYYNPAGITQIPGSAVSASYNNYVAGIQGGFLSYIAPWGKRAKLGFAINYVDYGSITRTDVDAEIQGDFSGSDIALSVTAAWRWPGDSENGYDNEGNQYDDNGVPRQWSGLSLGLTGKFIYESLDEYNSDALAVDLGLVHGLSDNRTRLGVSASNLGFQMRSLSQEHKDALPAILRAGIGHQLKAAPLIVSADVVKPFDNDIYLSAGLNLVQFQPLSVRAGYSTIGKNYKTDSDKDNWAGLSFGLGILLKKLVFDYAFIPYADIGSSHRIAISSRW
ncbi:MAG: hypothetical protein KKG33_06565 [candidate division Zixibacteria bacterium]|nr:hypothetical protein [candidate division Zixibacteria bacterium]MBU1470205.1 hypothetical protein [candidate division Zixibacteria bacterium]MBU2625206.1 hypothetical protein [candidate division Zixibacteria bacterium]